MTRDHLNLRSGATTASDPGNFRIDAGFASEAGRRKLNEDAVVCDPDHRLFAVFDGMGGRQAGGIASRTAARLFTDLSRGVDLAVEEPLRLREALIAINNALRREASRDDRLGGM